MTAQDLGDQIRLAFPATPYYGAITSCNCDECAGISLELRNKRWDQIQAPFLDLTCGPTLLTPNAFVMFLPAYMIRALDRLSRPDSPVVEFTVYSLCPSAEAIEESDISRLLDRARLMTAGQTQAVRHFLLYIRDNSQEREGLRPFIDDALTLIWT